MAEDPRLSKESPEQIEARIRDTRASLATKLSAIGDEIRTQVRQSVDRVTTKVESGVDQVTGTLDQSLSQVTSRVDSTIADVKSSLDVKARAQREPLKTFGLAVAAGFLLSQLGRNRPPKIVEKRQVRSVFPPAKVQVSPLATVGILASVLRPLLLGAAKGYFARSMREMLTARASRGGRRPAFSGETAAPEGAYRH